MQSADIMSTSYSEISGGDLLNPNYEVMDVSEDLLEDERDDERTRPDSFYPLENEGQRKISRYPIIISF